MVTKRKGRKRKGWSGREEVRNGNDAKDERESDVVQQRRQGDGRNGRAVQDVVNQVWTKRSWNR